MSIFTTSNYYNDMIDMLEVKFEQDPEVIQAINTIQASAAIDKQDNCVSAVYDLLERCTDIAVSEYVNKAVD